MQRRGGKLLGAELVHQRRKSDLLDIRQTHSALDLAWSCHLFNDFSIQGLPNDLTDETCLFSNGLCAYGLAIGVMARSLGSFFFSS